MGSRGMINPRRFRWAGRAYQVSLHRGDSRWHRWKGVWRAFTLGVKLEQAVTIEEFTENLLE